MSKSLTWESKESVKIIDEIRFAPIRKAEILKKFSTFIKKFL